MISPRMPNWRARCRRGGFTLLELSLSLSVLLILLAVAGWLFDQNRRFNLVCMAHQQCTAAARAQLDSLNRTGRPLGPALIQDLWPRVSLTVESAAGRGPWQGLQEVTVRAEYGSISPAVYSVQKRLMSPGVAIAEGD